MVLTGRTGLSKSEIARRLAIGRTFGPPDFGPTYFRLK
jgi:hypothetical protein